MVWPNGYAADASAHRLQEETLELVTIHGIERLDDNRTTSSGIMQLLEGVERRQGFLVIIAQCVIVMRAQDSAFQAPDAESLWRIGRLECEVPDLDVLAQLAQFLFDAFQDRPR